MNKLLSCPSLADLRDALVAQLEGMHYATSTIEVYECHIRRLDRFMVSAGIDTYSPDVGEQFLKTEYCSNTDRRCRSFRAVVLRLNDCLEGNGYNVYHCQRKPPSTPAQYIPIKNQYLKWCEEKGNVPSTLHRKDVAFAKLMLYLEKCGCYSLEHIEPVHITKVILLENNHNNYGYFREILKFFAARDILPCDYSTLVPKKQKINRVPTTYSRQERILLENTSDTNTLLGKRDHAIILLANRLGMRSCDIASLSFKSIDFDNNTICFEQVKTKECHTVCLLPDVRDAISDYITNGRPESKDKHIFIMHKAPYSPVSAIAIHGIVSKGFRLACVDVSNKKHGAHSLRSSLATDLVNSGESFDTARRILGHKSPDVIKHYAKLDVEHLRLCALDAREATGFFRRFLNGEEVLA